MKINHNKKTKKTLDKRVAICHKSTSDAGKDLMQRGLMITK
jgi:hypothetical protein